MNKKKLPVSLEFTLVSLSIITVILTIYTLIQLASFTFFTIDYQTDIIENKYNHINSILNNENSLETKIQSIEDIIDKDEDEEGIIIFKDTDIILAIGITILEDNKSNLNYFNKYITIKFIDFKPYIVLNNKNNIYDYNIQLVQEIELLSDFTENYLFVFLGTLIISIILSILGSIYLSRRFLGRLKILASTMDDVKQKNITSRVEVLNNNDEFDKINKLFNSMMDDIEKFFTNQSQFVSDASHELRTPLTVLQGHLKMLSRWGKNDKEVLDNSLNVCLDEVTRMIKMVTDLLALSSAEKEIINIDTLNAIYIESIILEIVDNYKILNNKIEFTTKLDKTIKLNISSDHLKQLLLILIDNSIKYNDKEIIKIEITLTNINNRICLSIKDNGIGIDEMHIPKVTDRFYKTDEARLKNSSFGLGLSIAKKLISLYNAQLVIKSTLGEYTDFIIIFDYYNKELVLYNN